MTDLMLEATSASQKVDSMALSKAAVMDNSSDNRRDYW